MKNIGHSSEIRSVLATFDEILISKYSKSLNYTCEK